MGYDGHGPLKKTKIRRVAKEYARLYQQIDAVMVEAYQKYDVQCKKGCSACCKQTVAISVLEALSILEPIVSDNYRLDRFLKGRYEVIKKQAKLCLSGKITGAEWFAQSIPCAFLKDDLCSIYERRPSVCRTHAVVTPSEDCSPPRMKSIAKLNIVGWDEATDYTQKRMAKVVDVTQQIPPMPVALLWATFLVKNGTRAMQRALEVNPVFANEKSAAMFWLKHFATAEQMKDTLNKNGITIQEYDNILQSYAQ